MAKNRTTKELKDAAEHLCYEIWMLFKLGETLSLSLFGKGPIHNALLNSFAIHIRNLHDFLYEPKGRMKSDAILAEHFFSSELRWAEIRPLRSENLKRARIRCDKQVAHLTYTRYKREPWDFVTIVRELHICLEAFMREVDTSLLGPNIEPIRHHFRDIDN